MIPPSYHYIRHQLSHTCRLHKLFTNDAHAIRSPGKIVNNRTEKPGEDDHEYPYDLVITFARFIIGTVNDHPDPECRGEESDSYGDQYEKAHKHEFHMLL